MDADDFQGMLERLRERYHLDMAGVTSITETRRRLSDIFLSTGRAIPSYNTAKSFFDNWKNYSEMVAKRPVSRTPVASSGTITASQMRAVGGKVVTGWMRDGVLQRRYYFGKDNPGMFGYDKAVQIYNDKIRQMSRGIIR